MNDEQQYFHFLKKVMEVLTLILDHNIPNGKAIPDSYRDILHALYKVYYNGEIDNLANEPLHIPDPVQVPLFPTTTGGLFDDEADKEAEKS